MLSDSEIEGLITKIREKIYIADRTGTLVDLLKEWKLEIPNYLEKENEDNFVSNPYGKILIIGESCFKQNHMLGLLKENFGLDNREALRKFDLKLKYEDILHFSVEKINKNSYSVILAGPMPHSAPGKADCSSVLSFLEKNESGSFPPVFRLMDSSGQLKVSKENVKITLEGLIQKGMIIL